MAFININTCFKEPQQLLRLIVLIICGCFTLYQLSECIKKLLHPPVATYYKFDLNDTMKYPSITYCRKPGYKKDLFPIYGLKEVASPSSIKAFANFNFSEHNINDFIETTTYSVQEISKILGFSGKLQDSSTMKIQTTCHIHYGRCYTITPTVTSSIFSIDGGYYVYFQHDVIEKKVDSYGLSTSGFQIYLHDENEILTTDTTLGNSYLHYLYLESAEEMRVKLKVQKYNQISTADEPCISEVDYSQSKCEEECYHLQIAQKVGCATKWLRIPSNLTFPTCANLNSVDYLVYLLTVTTERQKMVENCYCPKSCNHSVYTTYIIKTEDIRKTYIPNSMIFIYYSSNIVEVISKIISYDWNVFLSDIGGSLGFLLGLSVIGFISLIEEILKIIIKRMFKEKAKNHEHMVNEEEKEQNKIINNEGCSESKNYLKDYLYECEYFEKSRVNKEVDENNKY